MNTQNTPLLEKPKIIKPEDIRDRFLGNSPEPLETKDQELSFEDFKTKLLEKDINLYNRFMALPDDKKDAFWARYLDATRGRKAIEEAGKTAAGIINPVAYNKEGLSTTEFIKEHPIISALSIPGIDVAAGITGYKVGKKVVTPLISAGVSGIKSTLERLGLNIVPGLHTNSPYLVEKYWDVVEKIKELSGSKDYGGLWFGPGANEMIMEYVKKGGPAVEPIESLYGKLLNNRATYDLEALNYLDPTKYKNVPDSRFYDRVNKLKRELPSIELGPQTKAEKLKTGLFDTAARAKELQDKLYSYGFLIPKEADLEMFMTLYDSKVATIIRDFRDNTVQSIIKKMVDNGLTLDEVDEYLMASHAIDRNAFIRSITKGKKSHGGMPDETAILILEKIRNSGKQQLYEDIARDIYAINRARLELLVKSDLITKEEADLWVKNLGDKYVPFRGFRGESKVEDTVSRTKSFQPDKLKQILQPKGRETLPESPLAYTLQLYQDAVIAAYKNEVGKSFLELVELVPRTDMWTITKTKATPRIEKTGELVYNKQISKSGEYPAITVSRGGWDYTITIKDKPLAQAIKGTKVSDVNKLLYFFGSLNRALGALYTTYSPRFLYNNMIRDTITADINIQKELYGSVEGTAIKERPFFKAFKNEFMSRAGAINGYLKNTKEWEPWIKEFNETGGGFGYVDMWRINDTQKQIITELEALKKTKTVSELKFIISNIDNKIHDIGRALENVNRIIYYRMLREGGVSKELAAKTAKELTVNFNKRGAWAPALGGLYVFFNAGLMGAGKFAQAMDSPAVQRVVGGIVGASTIITLMNRMIDPEGYDGIPLQERNNNIILMSGIPGKYYSIPLPHGFRWFWGVGSSVTNSLVGGKDKFSDVMEENIKGFVGAFDPIGVSDSAISLVPSWLRPVLSVTTNTTVWGNPTHRTRPGASDYQPQGNPLIPKRLVSRAQTSSVERQLAHFLGEIGVDLYPEDVKTLITGYGGGIGDLALNIGRILYGEYDLAEIPFYNWTVKKNRYIADAERFWDNFNMMRNVIGSVKFYKDQLKRGVNPDTIRDPLESLDVKYRPFIAENGGKYILSVAKTLKEFDIKLRNAKSPKERDFIIEQRAMLMRQFNDKVESIMDSWYERELDKLSKIKERVFGSDTPQEGE